jgi:flavin reductase (DIM6/NTAB) family NADH-FMN oxidoreductase RutF
MSKITWKPGTMLYPVPAVLVTSHHGKKDNVLTVSWAGTVCTDPPMLSISLRPDRESYTMIRGSGEFAVNLPGEDLALAVDYCGVRSGRDVDKFAELGLRREQGRIVRAPLIAQCPVCIECRVKDIIELGSHHLFLSEVVSVSVEESLIDRKGKFHIENAKLLCYNHGQYYSLSKPLGTFGFSVRRKGRPGAGRQAGSGRPPRKGPAR